jgi:tRNA-intron endonuclease, archaea type
MSPLTSPPDLNSEEISDILEKGEFPETPIDAVLVGVKILIFNPIHGSILYGFGRYFGTPVGIRKPKNHIFDRPLELSLFEAVYLLKQGIILLKSHLKNAISHQDLYEIACKNYPKFDEKYLIYEDLRNKKYIPRPGQKFGADFIVYKKGPGVDHSSFCLQVLSGREKISSVDVVRAGRLATSVKKKFVLANPFTKGYFQFKWYKP